MSGLSSATTSILDRQQQLIDEFMLFDDWAERYQYLIDLGRSLPSIPAALRTEKNRLSVCQSEAFLAAERQYGRLRLYGESDMPTVAGVLAIAVRVYSGATPADIIRTPPVLLDHIGLTQRLSPHRRIALVQVHERLLTLASDIPVSGKLAS